MLFFPFERSDFVLCCSNSVTQNVLSILNRLTNLIDFNFLRICVSPCRLFPKLFCNILVETFTTSKAIQKLTVLASPDKGIGIEALLLERLSDFLDAEHFCM
jgi:hypothetical protein